MTKGLMMSFWRRLLHDLGLRRDSSQVYKFDEVLVHLVHDIAEEEQRSEEEIAADLLSFALTQRDAAEERLRPWQDLSPRERQVVALTCLNYTNPQIAQRLMISNNTVRSHVRNILIKFELHSKIELRQVLADWDFSAWLDA